MKKQNNFVGKLKDCYKGKRRLLDESPIVVSDIERECTNARGEDFSYLYDWYILDFNKLKEL